MKTLFTLFRKNIWFFLPFLVWMIAGGIMLCMFSKEELFLSVNQSHSPIGDILETGITYMGDGISFALLLVLMLIMQRFRLFFIGLITLLMVTLIVQVVKHYVNAPRPISYFDDANVVHTVSWVSVHGSYSFPSGHTAGAFGMFCFLALLVRNKIWGLVFFLLAIAAAHSRIYLAQHFFEDVYVGSIVGTSSCLLAYGLFRFRDTTDSPEVCQEALLQSMAEAKVTV